MHQSHPTGPGSFQPANEPSLNALTRACWQSAKNFEWDSAEHTALEILNRLGFAGFEAALALALDDSGEANRIDAKNRPELARALWALGNCVCHVPDGPNRHTAFRLHSAAASLDPFQSDFCWSTYKVFCFNLQHALWPEFPDANQHAAEILRQGNLTAEVLASFLKTRYDLNTPSLSERHYRLRGEEKSELGNALENACHTHRLLGQLGVAYRKPRDQYLHSFNTAIAYARTIFALHNVRLYPTYSPAEISKLKQEVPRPGQERIARCLLSLAIASKELGDNEAAKLARNTVQDIAPEAKIPDKLPARNAPKTTVRPEAPADIPRLPPVPRAATIVPASQAGPVEKPASPGWNIDSELDWSMNRELLARDIASSWTNNCSRLPNEIVDIRLADAKTIALACKDFFGDLLILLRGGELALSMYLTHANQRLAAIDQTPAGFLELLSFQNAAQTVRALPFITQEIRKSYHALELLAQKRKTTFATALKLGRDGAILQNVFNAIVRIARDPRSL